MEYVESLAFGVIDYDHLNAEDARELLAFLQTLTFRWALSTSYSHGATLKSGDEHKSKNPVGTVEYAYRVFFPFLSPVPGKEWPQFWQRLNDLFTLPSGRVRPDPKCKNSDRAYYVPTTHPDRQSIAQFYERSDLPQFDPSRLRLEIRVDAVSPNGRTTSLPQSSQSDPNAPGRKVTRLGLEALANRLKRKKVPTGDALLRVLDGIPWGAEGERDDLLFKVAGDIATEFPNADMREVAQFFALSVDRLRVIDESHGNPVFTIEDVIDKLMRRQAEIQADLQRKELEREAEREVRIRDAFREIGQDRQAPYTEDEIEVFAGVLGVSRLELSHRWIIQNGGAIWCLFNGNYIGPIKADDGLLAIRKYLSPAPIELDVKNGFGQIVRKTAQALTLDYGTYVRRIEADLNSDTCVVDMRNSTIIEAPCPLRPITPRFWPEVDEWLRRMAGAKHYDILLDWISWATSLDQPCTALFLQGLPGAGKSLFATGIARLWTTGGPSTMEQAFGNWTDAIMRCPLVFADEKVPKDNRGNARTEEIREFIQQRERPLKRRFCSDAVMRGATRIIIAANNRNLLHSHEAALTPHDVQAIADRIVLIPVQPDAATYLARLGSDGLKHWVSGDRIAEHALWIVENRHRNPNPPRFLVQGTNANLHIDIAFGTSIGSAVAHWLCSFLADPMRLWAAKHPSHSAFGIGYSSDPKEGFNPGIIVSAQTMADNWTTYQTNVRPEKATLRNIGLSLQAISEGRVTWHSPGNIKRQCARVPLANLIQWGEENGIHSETLMNDAAKLQGVLAMRTAR